MTVARRRSTLLVGLTLLVALLVGGRWLAIETAERAWAASLGSAAGAAYLSARDLARFVHGSVLLLAIAWGSANLYYVYRAIGSVQLPRRLGDLEIVEAVPQRVLLAGTLASGLVYGLLLALGSGGWWLRALLASAPPHFGAVDPVLHRDLGYYLGTLPWALTCQHFALRATGSAAVVVTLAYLGIGSLRFTGWRPAASAHARGHLGILLALLALALTWGAILDPAEVVAGLHGTPEPGALAVRIPGSRYLVPVGALTAIASLLWAVREQTRGLVIAWVAYVAAAIGVYFALPGLVHGNASDIEANRDRLERQAFGVDWRTGPMPRGFPSVGAAVARVPLWDPDRVAARVRRAASWRPGAPVAGLALAPPGASDGPSRWLVGPGPATAARGAGDIAPEAELDWTTAHRGWGARAGRPVEAIEGDSALAVTPVMGVDSTAWFGPAFGEFAVASPDTWPLARHAGIPLAGWWRRTALAWVLQSPELARRQTDGTLLLWRRDVGERLSRLAPFATFDAPMPVVVGRDLWWITYGYVRSNLFPLVRPFGWPGSDRVTRYFEPAFVGAVNGTSGTTTIYLAPRADSLAGAWARLFPGLVRSLDSLPAGLRTALPFPQTAFLAAVAQVIRLRPDSSPWRPWAREPYDLAATDDPSGQPRLWTAQAFEAGPPARVTAILAGAMSPDGPRLHLWTDDGVDRLPPELLGSPETAPGEMRLWPADGTLLSEQALFLQPATTGVPGAVSQVYLTWGDRTGQGATPAVAARALMTAGPSGVAQDTTLAARWELARRLVAAADSALAAGRLETFGHLYDDLKQLLEVGRVVAPPRGRR